MANYNIINKEGRIMLGESVKDRAIAEDFLKKYTDQVGKPYPNGKGFYPDMGYRLCEMRGHAVSPWVETYLDLDEVTLL